MTETTDSTSEEDIRPPPLPAKTRDSTDFSSLTHSLDWNPNGYTMLNVLSSNSSTSGSISTTTMTKTSITNTTYEYLEATNFSMPGIQDASKPRPPTPPPKPSRHSKHIPWTNSRRNCCFQCCAIYNMKMKRCQWASIECQIFLLLHTYSIYIYSTNPRKKRATIEQDQHTTFASHDRLPNSV